VTLAFVGLGSNLADPVQQVSRALAELDRIPHTRCLARSSLYRSPPLGPQDQPDFINAVAALDTALQAQALLAELHALEQRHGRLRREHWGPRTLDLDLLLYGDAVLRTETLTLPHPGLYDRDFVLYPLAELAGQGITVSLPDGRSLQQLLAACRRGGLERLPVDVSNQKYQK
jgi:2-amino-4-hydroxy-6-hydroxymethyldihydropteridine diphosphokinase